MLTYKIHPVLCDDIHYTDSQPFTKDEVWDVIGCDNLNSPNSDEEGREQIEVKPVVKFIEVQSLEESLSITTGHCDFAIATHARKMN